MKKILLIILTLCLVCSAALAQTQQPDVQIVYISKQTGTSSLHYPSLQGLPNTFVQDTINRKIVEKGEIPLHEVTMSSPAQQGATGITVTSEAYLLTKQGIPSVLSLVIRAEGKMPSGRLGYAVTPMMFSLADGSEIPAKSLWFSEEEAQQYLSAWVEELSQKDIFTYADVSGAVPVPLEGALLRDTGVTIFYPQDTFTLLSGRSGAFSFYFYELADILNIGGDAMLASLDAYQQTKVQENSAENIQAMLAQGILPGIPPVMGKNIKETIATYKELTDPEAFITGERYILEDAAFRDVSLIVPFGAEEITGILTHRMDLFGLITGIADRAACVTVLGEPDATLPLDADIAARYAMEAGNASFYSMGAYRLMLGFDQQDVLQSIYLLKESLE